jgi:hypothetical protein
MQLALHLLWFIWQIQDRIVRSQQQFLLVAGTARNCLLLLTIPTESNKDCRYHHIGMLSGQPAKSRIRLYFCSIQQAKKKFERAF